MANAENRTFNLPAEALAALSRLVEPATKDALDAIAEDIATCENLYRAIMDRGGQLSEDEAVFAKAFLEEVISLEGEHAGDAACTLGALHYSGSITPDGEPDYERAFELYSTGAALGNTQALVNLGYCHQYGRSVPVSPKDAFECFQRAALTTNMPEAIYKLGDMYERGCYVERDSELAFGLYRKAFLLIQDNPDEAPEIKASVCHRVADHIAADDTEDEPVAERRERLLTALELYQSAERDYYRAIGAGAYYYDRRLDEVIAAEERMRTEFLRR